MNSIQKGDDLWWRAWLGGKRFFDELVTVVAVRKKYRGREIPNEHRSFKVERKSPAGAAAGWVAKKDLVHATNAEVLAARLTDVYEREITKE